MEVFRTGRKLRFHFLNLASRVAVIPLPLLLRRLRLQLPPVFVQGSVGGVVVLLPAARAVHVTAAGSALHLLLLRSAAAPHSHHQPRLLLLPTKKRFFFVLKKKFKLGQNNREEGRILIYGRGQEEGRRGRAYWS